MWIEALARARDIGRLQEIASILIRHGLGDVVQRSGLGNALQKAGKALHWDAPQRIAQRTTPERVRLAFEELGPTFVKLGQVLSGRTDLLDPEWTEELAKLQQNVREVAFDELREQMTEDLGRPPEEVFDELQTEPLAAASIAQVHRARLPDGTDVVLKIRRPGIDAVVLADLRLLTRLAELVEDEMPELRRYQPRRVVRQFERTIKDELDLAVEGRNTRVIAENMVDQLGIVIPAIYTEYSSKRLLVQEFLDGPSATRWIQDPSVVEIDGAQVAARGADAVLKMVFEDGVYHADPHPGNMVFLGGDRIGLLDFGMVGRLSAARRVEFTSLLAAAVDRNEERAVEVLLGWSSGEEPDHEALSQDVSAFIDRYHGVTMESLDVNQLLADIAEIVRRNGLVMPSDVSMLLRAFVTLDGLVGALAPDFQLAEHVTPFARRAVAAHYAPQAVFRRGLRDLTDVLGHLPQDLRALLARARHGNLKVDLDLKRLDDFGRQIDHSANRLTMGMITAALIVGTSIALTVSGGPQLFGLPLFALLGFVSSLAFGLWLLWSIARSGRQR